jgi:anti-sigma B factor antagonist
MASQEVTMAANPLSPSRGLQLSTEKKGETTMVYGSGRITLDNCDLLRSTIRGLIPEGKRIVFDMTNVNHIDSSGIGALVSVYLAASKAQCNLELANLQPRIRDLFELARLTAVFESRGGSSAA